MEDNKNCWTTLHFNVDGLSLELGFSTARYVQRERQQRFYDRHKTHARFKRLQRYEDQP